MTMIYGRILHRRPFWFDGPGPRSPLHHEANPNPTANPKKTHYTLADTHSLDASGYLDIWQIPPAL